MSDNISFKPLKRDPPGLKMTKHFEKKNSLTKNGILMYRIEHA